MADKHSADELRFDGKVAIVTGAGGNPGLGRSYAMSLAARGARVVVNDLGTGPDGRGALRPRADAVAEEIVAAGGEAIADSNSVAEETSANDVVKTAIDAWGRLDILVNNAGVFHAAAFDEVSAQDLTKIIQVHLFGNIWMCRAALPFMKQQKYGRIVNVSSSATFGSPFQVVYGAAKAGIFGLTRGLAREVRDFGIAINAFDPVALTAGTKYLFDEISVPGLDSAELDPDLVAPAVVFLAHESCPCSGKFISSGARNTSEFYIGKTAGYYSTASTAEDIRDHFEQVLDREGGSVLPDPGTESHGAVLKPKPYHSDATPALS